MIPPSAKAPHVPTSVAFAGFSWTVKTSTEPVGPGPNVFSDDPRNVSVDSQGRLHLKIANRNGLWTCAEVINQTQLGYGTYTWTIVGDVTRLAPEAVLGMFTWSDGPAYANREIDIEFTKWAAPSAEKTGWYTIQTGAHPSPVSTSFTLRQGTSSVHTFTWRPGQVQFKSTSAGRTFRWCHAGAAVPVPGDETPRINLWLYQGKPPTSSAVSVVIRDFAFTPLGIGSPLPTGQGSS
jgi:hypothetical protein